jgi:CRISPR-associated protein Csd2
MFEHDRSASKGIMSVREPIVVFKHVGTDTDETQRKQQCKLGCAPTHKLFDLVEIKKKDGLDAPRSFTDYTVTFHKSLLPKGIEAGFVVTGDGGNAHVEWGKTPESVTER